jgi:acetyltransferase, GNAT family
LKIIKKYWEEKVDLKKENLKEFILKLNQKDINELMSNSEKEEDIIFYNKLFNLILETKQDELIKKGVF